MNIRNWPQDERPREKLIARGGAALSDAELLAVFLGSGRRGQNAVDLGRALIAGAGNLKSFLDMPRSAGIGAVAWCRLKAALELGRRYLDAEIKTPMTLADPVSCARFLKAQIGNYPYEVFACLFLDNRHRVITFEELFRGTINTTNVHAREVVRRCIAHNAAAIIFAHNHPSGIAEPSEDDRALTLRLREALAFIDVRVLDHFVVGEGNPVSLAGRGWL
jgi:DNA repair protein RadC